MQTPLLEHGHLVTAPLLTAAACDDLIAQLDTVTIDGAGTRNLLDLPWCAALARRLASAAPIAARLPPDPACVQCTYFEKSPARNWLVPLHQDLSIPVAARVDHPAIRGWSEKEGLLYAQPPAEVLEELLAVRLQLDEPGEADGALRVVPGSHRAGILTDRDAAALRDRTGETTCPVPRGGALLLRPLLLHASSKLAGLRPRGVLHFLFGPAKLPLGLQWARTA
ncbi:MAG: phytanoyl-CoA dioxygenase family protein [Planctomycetota bacterium]|nr:phytanoyl-CoA dioxygenase family protein [Planctomycetota bacterium]